MLYCAQKNTGSPEIGFVTVGEVLKDWQVKALGDAKIGELLERGVLKTIRSAPENPAEPEEPSGTATGGGAPDEAAGEDEYDESEPDEDETDEEEALPGADDMDDIVPEEPEAPDDEKPKRGRRRKAE